MIKYTVCDLNGFETKLFVLMSKNILLTGGTGFLGGFLGYEFLKRGYHVIFLARDQRNKEASERVATVLKAVDPDFKKNTSGSYEVWKGDVTKQHLGQSGKTLKKWKGKIDEVWHSAAALHFRDTYETITESININGTLNVLFTTNFLNVKRFHHISTAYVSGKCPGKALEIYDTHNYDFRNPYERTKYDAEQEVRKKAEQYGLQTTIYRPSVIVGDSKSGKTLSFTGIYNIAKIFLLIKRILKRKIKLEAENLKKAGIYFENEHYYFPLKFPYLKGSTINIVPIDYVVDTILKLAETPASIGQTYHVTNPNPPKILDLMKVGCNKSHLKKIEFVDCPFDEALHLIRKQITHYSKHGLNISFFMEIREYIHYFFGEPKFDISNVAETLDSAFKEPPLITSEFMLMLLEYAEKQNWKSAV